jgi:hypothetical protein
LHPNDSGKKVKTPSIKRAKGTRKSMFLTTS